MKDASNLRYANSAPTPRSVITPAKKKKLALNKEFYRQFKAVMQENIADPDYELKDLASEMNMCERKVQRIFSKNGSPGFRNELNLLRMREAARLISLDQKSITEIAGLVGFRGAMHFSKAFRRTYDKSPREWRAYCRQKRAN